MDPADSLTSRYPEDSWADAIGLEILAADAGKVRLNLPFRTANLNLGGRLHGGIIATALVDAGRLLTRAAVEDAACEVSPMDFQIFYLRPGGKHSVQAEARLLRRTRDLLFALGEVRDESGHVLATASMCFRAFSEDLTRRVAEYPDGRLPLPAVPDLDHPLAQIINQRYEDQGHACRLRHLAPGSAVLEQPLEPSVLDPAGEIAAGYLLFLADRIGSVASSAFARQRALSATVDMQLTVCMPRVAEPLLAFGRTLQHYGEVSHNRVELYGRDSGRLLVTGTLSHLLRPYSN